MNEVLELATQSKNDLVKQLEGIATVIKECEKNGDDDSVLVLYTNMYGAIEECITNQEAVIDELNTEVIDGRTVCDVIENIVTLNESIEAYALKFEAANKTIQSHYDSLYKLFSAK